MRRRRSHRSRRCRSDEWDTVDVFPPFMSDLFLPHLYCRRPRRPTHLLPSLSSVTLITPHLFCCPHRLASLPHLCCCYISCLTSPPPYPLPSLSAVPVISRVCFRCTYQPSHPLYFHLPSSPSSCISASAILVILHICRVSAIDVSIVPRLCRYCLHRYASLSPHSLRVFPPIIARFLINPPFLSLPFPLSL